MKLYKCDRCQEASDNPGVTMYTLKLFNHQDGQSRGGWHICNVCLENLKTFVAAGRAKIEKQK